MLSQKTGPGEWGAPVKLPNIEQDLRERQNLYLLVLVNITLWTAVTILVTGLLFHDLRVFWFLLAGTLLADASIYFKRHTAATWIYVGTLLGAIGFSIWFINAKDHSIYYVIPIPIAIAGLLLGKNTEAWATVVSVPILIALAALKSDLSSALGMVALPVFVLAALILVSYLRDENRAELMHWAVDAYSKAEHRSAIYYEQQEQLQKALHDLLLANNQLERLNMELDKARKQAEQANEVKSMFLAAMSHELRTPLNSILNFAQFVSSGMMGPVNEKQQEALEFVVSSGKHLLNLINDVLDISKIEAGALELFVEDNVNLRDELRTIAKTGESLLGNKPVALRLDVDENIPLIVGDRQRIFQIMMNLVSNACKFTQEGTILISARRQNGNVILGVKDTGPGIPVEEHETIFKVFRQTKRGVKAGGTGLGLPIARRLAQAHGGRLWLESQPGQGAAFFVELPIQSAELLAMAHEKEV